MSIERDSARRIWQHIQQNSPFVLFIGLLISAVLLGLAVNYFSSILFEWLWLEGRIGWQLFQAVATLVAIAALTAIAIYFHPVSDLAGARGILSDGARSGQAG